MSNTTTWIDNIPGLGRMHFFDGAIALHAFTRVILPWRRQIHQRRSVGATEPLANWLGFYATAFTFGKAKF